MSCVQGLGFNTATRVYGVIFLVMLAHYDCLSFGMHTINRFISILRYMPEGLVAILDDAPFLSLGHKLRTSEHLPLNDLFS